MQISNLCKFEPAGQTAYCIGFLAMGKWHFHAAIFACRFAKQQTGKKGIIIDCTQFTILQDSLLRNATENAIKFQY
jgi:hypothetical protein